MLTEIDVLMLIGHFTKRYSAKISLLTMEAARTLRSTSRATQKDSGSSDNKSLPTKTSAKKISVKKAAKASKTESDNEVADLKMPNIPPETPSVEIKTESTALSSGKRRVGQKASGKGSKVKKSDELSDVKDIEEVAWQPDNWNKVLENILKMRKMYVAPVDSLGCEECPEKGVLPEVFRYQTLISVMLSSQTKDEVTYAATQRLIEHGLNVDSILNTSDDKLGELIYPAGFWKSKVKYIKNTTQILKDKYKGDIPRTFPELCKLPGVGPKMANIVMSVGWKETVGIAVDTHVHRISNRLGWVPKTTKDPEQTRKALESWLPKNEWDHINVTLVGFGQTVCRPVGPHCDTCLNNTLCPVGKNALKLKNKKK